jgi:hypothetical protein
MQIMSNDLTTNFAEIITIIEKAKAKIYKAVNNGLIDMKGFSSSNWWRMRQFFETYKDEPKLAPLVREITWSNNILILSGAKTDGHGAVTP